MLVSKQNYFSFFRQRNNSFNQFFSFLSDFKPNGKILRVFLSFELVPFEFSIFLKNKGFFFFNQFFSFYVYEGVCVSFKRRNFGSSIRLRLVDEGVQYDRLILVFSPIVAHFQPILKQNYFYSSVRPRRSSFKFLFAQSQKKLITKLFF